MAAAPIDIIIAGVGGQGVVKASEVIARALLHHGLDVKKSEVHGMAQRGGSVVSHVRAGVRVYSPVIPEGAAGYLVGFERLEALRYARMLCQGGRAVVNRLELYPVGPASPVPYPSGVEHGLAMAGLDVVLVPAGELAAIAGEPRAAGIVLVGALSKLLPVSLQSWKRAVRETFGQGLAGGNTAAFMLGRSIL